MTKRTEQVASLLQKEVGSMLKKLELPAMTTISKVEVAPDLKWSKIGITIFSKDPSEEQEVMRVLAEYLYDMQGELVQKFNMKNVPRIKFVIDKAEEYADKINRLLREANESDSNGKA